MNEAQAITDSDLDGEWSEFDADGQWLAAGEVKPACLSEDGCRCVARAIATNKGRHDPTPFDPRLNTLGKGRVCCVQRRPILATQVERLTHE